MNRFYKRATRLHNGRRIRESSYVCQAEEKAFNIQVVASRTDRDVFFFSFSSLYITFINLDEYKYVTSLYSTRIAFRDRHVRVYIS